MYQRVETPRMSRRQVEALPGRNPVEAARRALDRVRKALTAYRPGVPFDPATLRAALTAALPQPEAEAERLFALGWLHWLDGSVAEAEPALVKAVDLARQANASAQLAEAAYWLARVRIRLDRADAVSGFETVLRQLGGSPQATAWFVDLLWRAGRLDRADQVWKSVRSNKRVTGCAEGPLLEARSLLRRGEAGGAVKALGEMQPSNGVVWVERRLLLAWAEVAQGRREKALEFVQRLSEMPYPRFALAMWRRAVEQPVALATPDPQQQERGVEVPAVLRDLERGYQALADGKTAAAVEAFRAALAQPAPAFARYALARMGLDSYADLLGTQPGLFLAVRCRVWLALERFRQRQGTPAEWLETLQREVRLGFVPSRSVEHFRRLAHLLRQSPDLDELRHLVEDHTRSDAAVRHNIVRAALEVVRRLPTQEARSLLEEWATLDWLTEEKELRRAVARQSLRLMLAEEQAPELLDHDALLQPAKELWHAATALASDESWREGVRGLRSSARLRPLAQALLLQEAARRGDVSAVVALLEELEAWRGFRPAPPRFVLRAVESVANSQPTHAGLRRALARWLPIWDSTALGPIGSGLAAYAGLAGVPASRAEVPAGVAAAPWLLHQAARALGREDFVEASSCVRRAQEIDPDWTTIPDADAVRDVLTELERRALAQSLAVALRLDERDPVIQGYLLTDLVDLLRQEGNNLLAAASQGDAAAVRDGLVELQGRPDLPPRLAHHLALIELRTAQTLEERDETAAAEPHWRRSWTAWLRFLAQPDAAERAPLVLDWLLAGHRVRITALLARNAVDAARRHWVLVQDLPGLAARQSEALGSDLTARGEHFRDELASEYLVVTRETMRYGDIPEGWRADYEKGLSHLRRLLSLDRDNVRLLTALVEVCGDWFLDLYNAGDRARLMEQVGRFVPFAQQLVRLVEGRPGDLAARAALSEYFKFRGFVAADRAETIAMYREALRLNPANGNVRELLEGLGETI